MQGEFWQALWDVCPLLSAQTYLPVPLLQEACQEAHHHLRASQLWVVCPGRVLVGGMQWVLLTGSREGSGQGLESGGQGDRAPGPRGDFGARGLVKGRGRSTGTGGTTVARGNARVSGRQPTQSVCPSLSVLTPHFKNPADAKLPWASGLSRLGVKGQAWAPAQGLGGNWAPAQNQLAGGAACGSVAGGGVARSGPGVHWGRAAWRAPRLS